MVLRHDNHPFMKFIPIIMTLLVRRWHSVQRLGKDISFHIKGLFQKNLEWYHFNLCIWIFLISCMHFSCSLSPLSLFHKFKCFLWSCWLLRLLVIKVKVGLLILGFAILDGLMVNLSFLMERSAFHHLSCLTVFSIHHVFLEHVLYFFFFLSFSNAHWLCYVPSMKFCSTLKEGLLLDLSIGPLNYISWCSLIG